MLALGRGPFAAVSPLHAFPLFLLLLLLINQLPGVAAYPVVLMGVSHLFLDLFGSFRIFSDLP